MLTPKTTPAPFLQTRIPEIDGLRGCAILSVIAFHYFEPLLGTAQGALRHALLPARMGWMGVNLFFALSGYLIGSILMANRDSASYFSTFYIRRFYRILPLYFAVVAGCYAVHALYMRAAGPPLYQYLTFTQNFWMASAGRFGIDLLAVTWSLAVEEQFYLFLPPLIRFAPPKRLPAIALGCVLLAFAGRYILIAMAGRPGLFAAQVLPFTHLDTLMLGVLLAWMRARDIAIPRWISRVAWLFSGTFITYFTFAAVTRTGLQPGGAVLFLGMVTVFCVSTLAIALDGGFRFLRWKPLTYTGLISYGLYLMHQPLNWAMHTLFHWYDRTDLRLTAVSFVVLYLIAALSWEWLEKPLVRLGHRFRYFEDPDAATNAR